jgi:hypothetical protein
LPKLTKFSYVTVTPEQALAEADAADAAIQSRSCNRIGRHSVAHKDIFCTQGIKTTAGSKMLDNFISPYDATVVAKAKAGLVTLGKVNMDEFAMGSTSESSYFGAPKTRGHWIMFQVVHQVVQQQLLRLILHLLQQVQIQVVQFANLLHSVA